MLELTSRNGEIFYVNVMFIEKILPLQGGYSEIYLTSGKTVVCRESANEVYKLIGGLRNNNAS